MLPKTNRFAFFPSARWCPLANRKGKLTSRATCTSCTPMGRTRTVIQFSIPTATLWCAKLTIIEPRAPGCTWIRKARYPLPEACAASPPRICPRPSRPRRSPPRPLQQNPRRSQSPNLEPPSSRHEAAAAFEAQNLFHDGSQVGQHEIAVCRPHPRRVNEQRGTAGAPGRFSVLPLVTDHERAIQVQVPFEGG